MAEPVDQLTLAPLIAIIQSDPDEKVRIEALEAATRLPLSNTAWQDLANAIFKLIKTEISGSAFRLKLLNCAIRIPLSSFRQQLRDLANSETEPDHEVIRQALLKTEKQHAKIIAHQNSALGARRMQGPLSGNRPVTGITQATRNIGSALLESIKAIDRHFKTMTAGDADKTWLGEELIKSTRQQIADKTMNADWPVAEIAERHVKTATPALDDDQIAWIISRSQPGHITRQVTHLLKDNRSADERYHLLNLLARTGDYLTGSGRTNKATLSRSSSNQKSGHAGAIITPRPKMSARSSAPSAGHRMEAAEEMATAEEAPAAAESTVASNETHIESIAESRRVHAQLRQQDKRRLTFLAGADNTIRCWIGLSDIESAAVAPDAIPEIAIPSEGLPLTAELCWKEQSDAQLLILPANRTARSGDCDLQIFVPEGERYVSAEIVFRYRGRAFEAVQIEAFAIGPGEEEQPHHTVQIKILASRRQLIELPDSHPFDATLIWGGDAEKSSPAEAAAPASLRVFGGQGGQRFELPGSVTALNWLNQSLFNTQKSLIRQRASVTANAEPELDADSPELLALLRDMARHGATLYNELDAQHFIDPGERIQLLNREPQAYVPLEFIYDRGYPADDAKLCDGWHAALHSNDQHCPVCSQQSLTSEQRDWTPTICPLGFWSMQKIIERIDPDKAGATETTDGQSHPSLVRRSLPPIDNILYATSHKVPEDERQATFQKLQQQFRQPQLANNWDEWKTALQRATPPLLLTIPHHDVSAALDFLEIGDDQLPIKQRRLSRAQITDLYVNPTGADPGPILLILGCRTGTTTEDGYVRLTRRFQQLKTSIVLGTMAQILGRHAAPVARELVTQLVEASDPEADFGTIMRQVRRRMLANGYLMAFCLVALGDAEWRLTPRLTSHATPSESNHVPY